MPSIFSESLRLEGVQAPIIPIVGELIQQHPGTISLGQGVVYYDPPGEIERGLSRFAREPANHRYQEVEGIQILRELLATKLEGENQIDLSDSEIVVTAGSNMAFLEAVLAITDPGDDIILTRPCYFNHEMAVQIAGCHPILVDTDEAYHPVLKDLETAITPKTRAIVTISPNNPTGAIYPPALLDAINDLCREHQVFHISDEAYEYFVYDEAPHYSPASRPGVGEYTISLYSLSKSFSMASWRIGYMVIPAQLKSAVKKIQDTNVICPPVISQFAACEAIRLGGDHFKEQIQALKGVRAHLYQGLADLDHVRCGRPGGAFYAFIELPECRLDDLALTRQLISRFGVAVIPGSAFKMQDSCYVRVSYGALEPEQSKIGIERLIEGLNSVA